MSSVIVPEVVDAFMCKGAALVVSISAGKDSQAMLSQLARLKKEKGTLWPGPIVAVYSDLGRAAWANAKPHAEQIAAAADIDLVVVRREKGDLQARIEQRLETVGRSAPAFPSAAARYCTSSQKREPINKYLRKYQLVISAEGHRWDESAERRQLPRVKIRKSITAKALQKLRPETALQQRSFKQRVALNWYPIIDWSEHDVWTEMGTTKRELHERRALWRKGAREQALAGWPASPVYVYGMDRQSCTICILASKKDIAIGARMNPEYARFLASIEGRNGYGFKKGFYLSRQLQEEQNNGFDWTSD